MVQVTDQLALPTRDMKTLDMHTFVPSLLNNPRLYLLWLPSGNYQILYEASQFCRWHVGKLHKMPLFASAITYTVVMM